MGLPIIQIDFKQLAKTVIQRSQRGIVALILKDTAHLKATISLEGDIPATLTVANQNLIKEVLKGNVNAPNKILLYVLPSTGGVLADALTYFETQEFNILTMPGAVTADNTAIKAFIDKMRTTVNYKCQAILKSDVADKEGIINFTSAGIKVGGASVTDYTHRIAGLLAGTPLNQSITYSVLDEVQEVEALTKAQADTRIDAGELILVRDMGKIRVARGVNSLTTTTQTKGAMLKKIQVVAITDLIHNDIRRVLVDKYIGKMPNNYDNKCVLISEISNYLNDLAKEQLVEDTFNVGIDLEAQKTWLKANTSLDVNNMTEQEIKEANTQDKVFIGISLKVVSAMEDIYIGIAL